MKPTSIERGPRWWAVGLGLVLLIFALILALAPSRPPTVSRENHSVIAPAARIEEQPRESANDAEALLAKMHQAYRDVSAAEFAGTITRNENGERRETTFTSSFAAPVKFRHATSKGALTIGSDGEQVFVFNRRANEFLIAETGDAQSVADMPERAKQLLQEQNPSLLLALLEDPGTFRNDFVRIERAPDVTIDGRLHPALHLSREEHRNLLTLILDPETHLLKRVLGETQVDYTTARTGVAFSADHFAWLADEERATADARNEEPQEEPTS